MDAHRAAPRGLTRYVDTAGAAALAATAALAWDRPGPSWVPFLFPVALFVYAENTALDSPRRRDELELHARDGRRRDLQGRRSPGRGGRHRAVRGPYWPHLRRWEWRKMSVNTGAFGLAAAVWAPSPRVPRVIAAQTRRPWPSARPGWRWRFFAVNTVVVAGYYAISGQARLKPVLGEMLRHGHLQVYPFALLA